MPDPAAFVLLAAAVVVGALVQGSVGLGFGLVAAPVVTLVAPDLMPGLMLWLAVLLPVLTVATEWRATDWRGLGWVLAGALPGTVAGVAVVALVSARLLGVLVGGVVLATVVLTGLVDRLPTRAGVLAGAGLLGGVTGTATSINGPPLALVYQHAPGARLRATMGAYFVVGGTLSLVGLAAGHQLTGDQTGAALALAPFLLVGFALSRPLRRHLDAGRTRRAVLVVCTLAAVVLLARSLAG